MAAEGQNPVTVSSGIPADLQITSLAVDLSAEATYTVSDESAGVFEFVFNGTARMRLLSLDDTEIEDVTVTDL